MPNTEKTEAKPLQTRIFKMSSRSFAMEMVFRYGGWWVASLSILGLIGLALGIVIDLRWLVVALLIIFIVLPMVMAFLYYNYALRKECAINTVPHYFVVKDEGLLAVAQLSNKKDKDHEDNQDEDENPGVEELEKVEAKTLFPYCIFQPFVLGSDALILKVKKGKGFIWIPADAFENAEEMPLFLEYLDAMIPST